MEHFNNSKILSLMYYTFSSYKFRNRNFRIEKKEEKERIEFMNSLD